MSESKTNLLAEVERMRGVVRAAADLLIIADDYYADGVTPFESRHLEPLRVALYGSKVK